MESRQVENITLVPAGKQHARMLGRIMRLRDRVEVVASGNFTVPEMAVRASINRSQEVWAAFLGPDLLAVYGVTVFPDGSVPWMLSSVYVDKYPLSFWRASKIILSELRGKYPSMVQMVFAGYPEAIEYTKRLGFKIEPPVKHGSKGQLFCRISLETPKLIVEASCATP